MNINTKNPTFIHSAITFFLIAFVIGFGLFKLEISLHSLMLICLLIASLSAYKLSNDGFLSIRAAMNAGIQKALNSIYIFILIGALIAALIQSGTVGTLIYYGLEFLSPSLFLPTGLILCSLMSIATGTSWGTVGTAGVILMGIGTAMNIPLAMVAGVVVSGACFGDKMSPVSDTTNLAAMSSEVDLYKHIKSMSYTTIPTYLLVFILYTIIGFNYLPDVDSSYLASIEKMKNSISSIYSVNLLTLIPILAMLFLIYKKVAAEVAMFLTVVVAVLTAIVVQGIDFITVMNALYGGHKVSTGIDSLDSLLGRGGMASMMWTLLLALMAIALGGILHNFKFLSTLIEGLIRNIKSIGSTVSITISSCLLGNMVLGEAYMSIILGGQVFKDIYDKHKLDRRVLSRSIEEGATLTTGLIPWTTGGAFFATTLGVSVLDFAPWALLNWINPLVGIIFAILGIGIFSKKEKMNA